MDQAVGLQNRCASHQIKSPPSLPLRFFEDLQANALGYRRDMFPIRVMVIAALCFFSPTIFAFVVAGAVATPQVPRADQAVRYERIRPVFQSKEVAKERGDALLALLDGGRVLEKPKPSSSGIAPKMSPPRNWIDVILADGSVFRIGLGGYVYLPDSIYVANEAVAPKLAQWVSEHEADLRREVLSVPKPCSYPVGIVEGTDTLSGIARLFYNDAGKWPKIYDANKAIIKNPNLLSSDMVLTIPAL